MSRALTLVTKRIVIIANSLAIAFFLSIGWPSAADAQSSASDFCGANAPACIQVMNELDSADAEGNSVSSAGIIDEPAFALCWKPYIQALQTLAKLYTAEWKALVARGMSVNQAKLTAVQKLYTSYKNLQSNYTRCYTSPQHKLNAGPVQHSP